MASWPLGAASADPLLPGGGASPRLAGPAIDHPASPAFHPATLALRRGFSAYASGLAGLDVGRAARLPIDPATGAPSPDGARRFAEVRPSSPRASGLLLLAHDFGADAVTLGLALEAPYEAASARRSEGDFVDGPAEGPARYHLVALAVQQVRISPMASWRILERLALGVSLSFVWTRADFAFVRDAALEGGSRRGDAPLTTEPIAVGDCGAGTPCGYESDAAAEGMRIAGTDWGLSFAAGILFRATPRLDVGLTYRHDTVSFGGGGKIAVCCDAWVRRAPALFTAARAADPNASRDLRGRGTLSFATPRRVTAGLRWQVTPRLDLTLDLSWTGWSRLRDLDLRFTGTALRDPPEVPDRVVHHRGFQDAFGARAGARLRFLDGKLRLDTGLGVESAAVPRAATSPAAIDGFRLNGLAGLAYTALPGLTVHAGYAVSFAIPRSVGPGESRFDPGAMVRCVDGHYDVDLPACRAALGGRGLPSAAGDYGLHAHRFAVGVAFNR